MASFQPTINFGGLASGLDTNTIVSQLMAIEQRPQVRLKQQQVVENARLSALREVSTKLTSLSFKIATLRDAGTWGDTQTVESSEASKITVARTGGAPAGAYAIDVGQLARAAQSTSALAGPATTTGTLTLAVGSASIDVAVTAGDTLATVASRINGSSGTPVYASVVDDKLVLTGKTTGAAATIAASGTAAAQFGIAETQSPLDAQFWVNDPTRAVGTMRTSASNVVTNAVSGVSLTLKATNTSSTSVTVGTPGPNTEAITTAVKAFVDEYNATVDLIRGKLAEDKVRNPTTDAQRAKGALAGDAGLTTLLAQLRQAVGTAFSGQPTEMSVLAQAGVSTGAATGAGAVSKDALAGKLSVDTAKLSEQLLTRFADVKELFTNATGSFATEGVAQRLDRYLSLWTKTDGVIDTRIATQDGILASLSRRIGEFDTRLALREKTLRAQFTSMEKALQAAQDQGAWLSSQLSALDR